MRVIVKKTDAIDAFDTNEACPLSRASINY